MAGRRPKPLAIHRLAGNPQHMSKADLMGVNNPQPQVGVPEIPKGIPKAARREWRRVVAQLLDEMPGVLTKVDGPALADYCRATAMVEIATKDILEHGMTFRQMYENSEGAMVPGDIKPNPSVAQLATYMKVKKAFETEFGMTPASRSKLRIAKKDDGDAMEQFLTRKKSTPMVVRPEDMTSGGETRLN